MTLEKKSTYKENRLNCNQFFVIDENVIFCN